MRRALLSLLFLALPLAALAGGDTAYILSSKAKLLEKPAFSAPGLAELQRGDKVTVVTEQGRWSQVRYQDKLGWLPKLQLSEQPPLGKLETINKKQAAELADESRRRASANTTTAAARGLRADDQHQRASDTQVSDYGALERIDAFTLKPEEVDQFLHEGLK